jgi:hypothetical protein
LRKQWAAGKGSVLSLAKDRLSPEHLTNSKGSEQPSSVLLQEQQEAAPNRVKEYDDDHLMQLSTDCSSGSHLFARSGSALD